MTPLVLLPGMMCDARVFAPLVAAIRDRPVRVADLTGADTTAALARAVLAAAPGRVALAGLSMGGIVAMEALAVDAGRIAGLCLMGTNPKAEHPAVAEARAAQVARAAAGGLARVMEAEVMPAYLAAGSDRAILATCRAMAAALGPDVFARQSAALATRADRRDALRAAAVPTLVLCGREDALCPVHRHEAMHALVAGSRLTVIEGAGHLAPLEAPGAVLAEVAGWLAAVDAAEGAA